MTATYQVASHATRMVRPSGFGSLEETIFEGRDSYSRMFAAERLEWVACAAEHHIATNPIYRRLAEHRRFSAADLRETRDFAGVPLLSSGVFKRCAVASNGVTDARLCLSSGTRGIKSVVPRDAPTLERFVGSVLHAMREFGQHSDVREGFILGPPASEVGDLWFSYVLTLTELVYDVRFFVKDGKPRLEELYETLIALDPASQPSVVAPPGLLLEFLQWMEEHSLRINLRRHDGYVLTAGGWKRREQEAVDREDLVALIEDRLAIKSTNVRDAFNMVELNTLLMECEHHRMHTPPWLVAQVLRPADMSPTVPGEEGILAFLDPTATSYPAFILSDDFGAIQADSCPCGRRSETIIISRRIATIEERGCGLKLERYSRDG